MKNIFFIISFFIIQSSISQNKITEIQKIESFIHIWGLIKYKHPEVSKGEFDINEEFLKEFDKLPLIENQVELNAELLSWIRKLDSNNSKFETDSTYLNSDNIFKKNSNYNWIENSGFDDELIQNLNKIKNNINIKDFYASKNRLNHMVSFKNEKGFDNFDGSKISNRILFLSSFWNAMKYWNVNIYLTDQPWSQVLTEMIPEFMFENNIRFELAKDKLFSKLNDSHSNYSSSYLLEEKLDHFAYFGGKIINDSLVITKLFDKDLALKEKIELGDVIASIEGKTLKNYYGEKFNNSISVSNQNYMKSRIENYFLLASGSQDTLQIELLKKNGTIDNRNLKLSKLSEFRNKTYDQLEKPESKKWFNLTEKIGYLNLKNITKPELKNAFKEFEKHESIVIDLRNYPKYISESDITRYLYPEKRVFIKVLAPLYPGYGQYDIKSPLRIIKNPFSAGRKNKGYYKGKVVLLVDRKTGSKAEFIGMAIQGSPNCITIGEQTFGAVMNRNEFTLPDKTTIDFTGMGAFYPNDIGVQRKGLKIDYPIQESARNYNPNLYIEQTINILQK